MDIHFCMDISLPLSLLLRISIFVWISVSNYPCFYGYPFGYRWMMHWLAIMDSWSRGGTSLGLLVKGLGANSHHFVDNALYVVRHMMYPAGRGERKEINARQSIRLAGWAHGPAAAAAGLCTAHAPRTAGVTRRTAARRGGGEGFHFSAGSFLFPHFFSAPIRTSICFVYFSYSVRGASSHEMYAKQRHSASRHGVGETEKENKKGRSE